jgi:hypothetical protein
VCFNGVDHFQGQVTHINEVCLQIFGEETETQTSNLSLVYHIVHILKGLKIVMRKGPCYAYNGPNAFDTWEQRQFQSYSAEFDIKMCRVLVKKENVPPHMYPRRARKRMQKMSSFSGHGGNLKRKMHDLEEKVARAGKLTEEQQRSVDHMTAGTVCKCGYKETQIRSDGRRATITKGYHPRHRCKKCENCRAPRCGKCKNCLIPSNKQTCINKNCMFPRTPNCPYFE